MANSRMRESLICFSDYRGFPGHLLPSLNDHIAIPWIKFDAVTLAADMDKPMSLNPLTLIEKTINEHGSAAILKERIDLARDQYAALERKLADATALLSQYRSTIEQLQLQNERLELEMQKHQAKIDELKARLNPKHTTLHENEETILKHLAGCDHATVDEIASCTLIGKQTTRMHVDNLESLGLIESFHSYISNPWRLTDNGRKRMFALDCSTSNCLTIRTVRGISFGW